MRLRTRSPETDPDPRGTFGCGANFPPTPGSRRAAQGSILMRTTVWRALAALITIATLGACAPLLIGGGAAIVADEVIEQDQGGDGIF